jgi:hypothetical protein
MYFVECMYTNHFLYLYHLFVVMNNANSLDNDTNKIMYQSINLIYLFREMNASYAITYTYLYTLYLSIYNVAWLAAPERDRHTPTS